MSQRELTGKDVFAALVTHAPVRVERTRAGDRTRWTILGQGNRPLLRTFSDRKTEREIAEAVAFCVNATVRALAP